MSTPDVPPADAPPEAAPVCYRHPDREAHIRCQRCGRTICPDCMRPAAVGFQCPSCVKEGSRDTRAGRTAYGGQLTGNPALTSQVLIAINVALWVAVTATGGSGSRLVDLLALRPSAAFQGQVYPQFHAVAQGDVWQLVTSMFLHVSVTHIGFNMLALWVLGPQLELALGRLRFLAVYLVSGLAGSAAVMLLSPSYQPTLGASGAIFGLMGALLVIAVKVRGDVRGIATWIGINFVITVLVNGISWQAHAGGFVGGVVLGVLLAFAPRAGRTTYQLAGVGVTTVVVVALIVVRALALAS